MHILITGGAGFIGRYVARECLARGHSVRILDNFSRQIHGDQPPAKIIAGLRPFIEGPEGLPAGRLAFVTGDVCDPAVMKQCLAGSDAVIHLAAETGTGQSMYDVSHYSRVNIGATALLAELLAEGRGQPRPRVVLASSRAVYGEGQYSCGRCGPVFPPARETARMQAGLYEPCCPRCAGEVQCVPTGEEAARSPSSFYGLTKSVQEDIIRMFAQNLGFAAYILRFQNVYGPMQSLSNPYTGILSIFSTLARRNQPIKIFEDGLESRDFVHVADIARAIADCMDRPGTDSVTLNLGTGVGTTVQEVAETIKVALGSQSEITVTGQFRAGDIRHAIARISAAQSRIDFAPRIGFRQGIEGFMQWVSTQETPVSNYEGSLKELASKGLLHERRPVRP